MDQELASQFYRPYLPNWLRERIGSSTLRPGAVYPGEATVLYADLSGFTSLTAAFTSLPDGAERLHDALNRYYQALIDTIGAYGGDVAAIAGDALTAWWPGLIDPELARRCGSALHAAMAALPAISTPAGPFQLDLRIGVSAGAVYMALTGLPNYGIHPVLLGPAIAAATAAERLARPGFTHYIEAPATDGLPLADPEPPGEAGIGLSWEHFLPPTFADRLRLNELVAEYRRCVPAFCAFQLPARPADLHRLVAQTQAVVLRWGGWLNEVEVGDKGAVFVLLFGAPVSRGDDPNRAVGCCLELRDRGLITRAGISVGILFVGDVGGSQRRVYTAQGDDMNLAAHLMERAEPGSLLVSGRIRQDIRGRYRTGKTDLLRTKGRAEGVPVAQIISDGSRIGQGNTTLHRYVPDAVSLVGRDHERQLLATQAQAVWAGAPQLAMIEGESGIGKSSLLQDLAVYWVGHGWRGFGAECLSGGRMTALLAWRPILLDLLGVDQSTSYRAQRAQISRAMRAFAGHDGPTPTDQADERRAEEGHESPPLSPHGAAEQLLIQALGIEDDQQLGEGAVHRWGQEERQELLGMLARVFRGYTAGEPLLIVLEDIHWADELSLELAHALLSARPPLPIYLALSHRPFDGAPSPALAALRDHEGRLSIRLERLSPSASLAFIRNLLGVSHVQNAVAQHVERHTEGQPLFIKEYVRILLQNGLIEIEDDSVRLARPMVSMQMSNSAQGVIQAHVDRLDEPTRLTLKIAAVIGRSFPRRLLATIHPTGVDEERLRDQLQTLIDLQIIDQELGEPDPVYRFKHGITHEVAYTSLLFGQRRQLHTAVASWYEQAYASDMRQGNVAAAVYDVLIDHLRRAEQWERAARFCRQAADRAAQRAAHTAALRYVDQALLLTADLGQRYYLTLLRVAINDRIGNQIAQTEDLAQLSQLAAQIGNPLYQAYADYFQIRYLLVMGMYQRVIDHAAPAIQQARRLARSADEATRRELSLLRAGLIGAQGEALGLLGSLNEARARHRRALQICWGLMPGQDVPADGFFMSIVNPQSLAAQSLDGMGAMMLQQDQPGQALRCHQRALDLARTIGDWCGETRARLGIAEVLTYQAQYETAAQQITETLSTSRAVGDNIGQVRALRQLAMINAASERYAEAQRYVWHALALCTSARLRVHELQVLHDLALFAAAQGLEDEAEAAHQEAERVYRQWWGSAGLDEARAVENERVVPL